jgi:hypothetical protein
VIRLVRLLSLLYYSVVLSYSTFLIIAVVMVGLANQGPRVTLQLSLGSPDSGALENSRSSNNERAPTLCLH